jgi:hypothetical protein
MAYIVNLRCHPVSAGPTSALSVWRDSDNTEAWLAAHFPQPMSLNRYDPPYATIHPETV